MCSPGWPAGGAREGVDSLSAGQAGGGDGGRSQSAQSQGQRTTQQFDSSAFCTFGFLGEINPAVLFISGMQTEAQCEQLSRELLRHRQQVEREAHTLKERLAQAREEGRSEVHKQKEELMRTVGRLPITSNTTLISF